MKILITGATGYIGSRLVVALRQVDHEIYAVARQTSDTNAIRDYVSGIIYISPHEQLYQQIKLSHCDVLINLMGSYTSAHDENSLRMLMEDNIVAPMTVCDAAAAAGIKKIIATASVQQSFSGESADDPINAYGATRNAFEAMLKSWSDFYGISVTVLTLFDTYGADDKRGKVFNLVRRLHDGESIDMSPGEQKLYQLYIDDVVAGYLKAIELICHRTDSCYEKYAIRSEEPIRLKEFIKQYLEMTRKNVEVNWGGRSYMDREIMDPTGFGTVLPGWKANISYTEGLRRCADADLSE